MNFIITLCSNFLTPEYIAKLIAHLISIILQHCSKKGGVYWDRAKITMKKIKIWVNLFEEIYEDDKITKEEEEKLAQYIKKQTKIEKLLNSVK